jgi:hypothetical protein
MTGTAGRWCCPACGREFSRPKQGHTCVPGGTVDDTFRGFPPEHRAIYEAIVSHLQTLGDIHMDPVHVGVFLLRTHKLAEVRPRPKGVHLGLALPNRLDHPRFLATKYTMGDRTWQSLTLRNHRDVDDELRSWLTQAFLAAE